VTHTFFVSKETKFLHLLIYSNKKYNLELKFMNSRQMVAITLQRRTNLLRINHLSLIFGATFQSEIYIFINFPINKDKRRETLIVYIFYDNWV